MKTTQRWLCWCLLGCAPQLFAACGASDRNLSTASGGKAGTESGGPAGADTGGKAGPDSGGTSPSGATANGGTETGPGGDTGTAANGGVSAGAGGGETTECTADQKTCMGNAPATCSAAGTWVTAADCSGSTPACSNGVCAAAKVSGGIVSIAPLATQAGNVRLVEQTFEVAPTTCGKVAGQQVCVTGGIRP